MSVYKFFSDDEVVKWGLAPQLWSMLDDARGFSGVPFIITSGRRTPDGNSVLKGAVPDSSHLSGLGVDLWVEDNHHLEMILRGLSQAKFRRRGLYFISDPDDSNNFIPRHIHVDIDPGKPQDSMWCKREQN